MSIKLKCPRGLPIGAAGLTLWALLLGSVEALRAQHQPDAAAVDTLTLEDALSYARMHSPRLAAAEQVIVTEEADLAAASAFRFPRLDVGAAYSAAGKPTQTAVSFPVLGLGAVPAGQAASRQHANAGVYATIPIWLGGRIGAATRLAEAEREVARADASAVERDLVFGVTRTYARLVELERDVRAAERSVEALDESRRVTQEMLELGKAPRVDLLKVDTRLAEVRAELIEFRNARRIEAGRLNALLGRPVGEPVAVQARLPRPEVRVSIDEAIQVTLRANPAYRAAERHVEVATRGVELAEAQLRPSLSLGAGYRAQSVDPLSDAYAGGFVAGVAFSLPVLDRTRSWRIDEAESREEQRRAELAQFRLDIEERVRTAYLQVADAAERIQATEAAIAFAEEALRIEQEKQRLGRGTIENLLDTQAALLTSEANYYQALADYTTAVAALEHEIGQTITETERQR